MRRTKRNIIAIALAGTLGLGLSACDRSAEPAEEDVESTTVKSTQGTGEPDNAQQALKEAEREVVESAYETGDRIEREFEKDAKQFGAEARSNLKQLESEFEKVLAAAQAEQREANEAFDKRSAKVERDLASLEAEFESLDEKGEEAWDDARDSVANSLETLENDIEALQKDVDSDDDKS